jgi:hypothetical protein
VRAGLESAAWARACGLVVVLLGVLAMPRISCAGFGKPERVL